MNLGLFGLIFVIYIVITFTMQIPPGVTIMTP